MHELRALVDPIIRLLTGSSGEDTASSPASTIIDLDPDLIREIFRQELIESLTLHDDEVIRDARYSALRYTEQSTMSGWLFEVYYCDQTSQSIIRRHSILLIVIESDHLFVAGQRYAYTAYDEAVVALRSFLDTFRYPRVRAASR